MKVCDTCNIGNNDDAKYCQKCGKDIENVPPLLNVSSAGVAPTKDYTRLGGWLMFFVVMNFVVAGLFLFNIARAFLTPLIPNVETTTLSLQTMLSMLPFAISFISSIMIIRKDSRFLFVLQIYYIASLIYNMMWIAMGKLSPGGIAQYVVMMAVVPLLWTLYFCRSKRVNAYMGGDEYKQKALIKF